MGNIQKLGSGAYNDILELSQFAFQYELSKEEIEKKKKMMHDHEIYGYYDDQRLVAKVHVLPLQVWIQKAEYHMGGLSSVASWPEYRRKGIVKDLIKEALNGMKENGQTISMLYPFSFAFYRKYGWESFVSYKKYGIEVSQFPNFPQDSGSVKRVGKNFSLLNDVYDLYAKQYNGMLKRTKIWWEDRVFKKNEQASVWLNQDGQAKGYLIYTVKEEKMNIREMIFIDEEARIGLWNFIKNHDSMIKSVELHAPEEDQLSFLFDNPRFKQETVPYFMARIVDVEAFLKQYPFEWPDGKTMFLHIEDDFLEWNNGIFHIKKDENIIDVTKFNLDKENSICVKPPARGLRVDIQTLTAMLLGYHRPQFLYNINRLKGSQDEVKVWESILPNRKTYFVDFF